MTFTDIPAGTAVFVDANVLVYHFMPEPALGAACRDLLERFARQELAGFTSAHIVSNVAHRMWRPPSVSNTPCSVVTRSLWPSCASRGSRT